MHSDLNAVEVQQAESVRRALAGIEKSARRAKYRLIAVRGLAILAALWFGFDRGHASTLLDVECTICLVVGVMVAVCTERIRSTMNTNTLALLKAIEEGRSRE